MKRRDLKRMRSLGVIDLGMAGYVSRLSWPRPGTLFAAVGQSSVVLLHPGNRQVFETRKVDGVMLGDIQAIRAGMLALVGPRRGSARSKPSSLEGRGRSPSHSGGGGGYGDYGSAGSRPMSRGN